MTEPAPCTRAVRAGIESDTQHGAVVPALHLSTNYSFAGFGRKRAYDYSRSGNPPATCSAVRWRNWSRAPARW